MYLYKRLEQNNIYKRTWFFSIQNPFIPRFQLGFCEKIWRAYTISDKIHNARGVDLSEENTLVFHWKKVPNPSSTYNFLIVLFFIS